MTTIEAASIEINRVGWPYCQRDEMKLSLDYLRIGDGAKRPDQARLYCEVCGIERSVELMLDTDHKGKWKPGFIVYNPRGEKR